MSRHGISQVFCDYDFYLRRCRQVYVLLTFFLLGAIWLAVVLVVVLAVVFALTVVAVMIVVVLAVLLLLVVK